MAKASSKPPSGSNGADLGFEATPWVIAAKLRGNFLAVHYKNVVLGAILLNYTPDAFVERHTALLPKLLSGELRVPTAEKAFASHA